MRYQVTILDFGPSVPWFGRAHVRKVRNVTLAQASRIAMRSARKGLRLYGGNIVNSNWGTRGGVFPYCYRSAVIELDRGRA